MRRPWGIAAVALLAMLAGNATAPASIPDSNGVITSCYSTDPAGPFGALRVIDPGAAMTCNSGENQLTILKKHFGPDVMKNAVNAIRKPEEAKKEEKKTAAK